MSVRTRHEALIEHAFVLDEADNHPKIIYRPAGDQYLLVDYQVENPDVFLSIRINSIYQRILQKHIRGVIDGVPVFKTLLVHYDSVVLPLSQLIDLLKEIEKETPSIGGLKIDSRILKLPLAFADRATKECVESYCKTIRHDAPYVIDGHNLKYIAMYNGLSDAAVIDYCIANTWFVANLGFTPGQPNLLQLDPRYELTVPKYNPPRAWTPEGAFALGGQIGSIYPTPSPGGYQFLGRTVPIYSTQIHHSPFEENPVLLKTGDRINFVKVNEFDLEKIRERISRGEYSYEVVDSTFDAGEHRKFLEIARKEASEFKIRQAQAARQCPMP